jgi:multidrug transporter EmrE-like cation transporter
MNYLFIFSSILLGALAQIALKYGANKGAVSSGLVGFINPQIITGLGLYGLSALLWIYALSKVQLSFAYPMVALGYVVVTVLSYVIFKEDISTLRISGLSVIVIGVIMIAKS